MKKKSWLKKMLIVFGVLGALFVAAAVILPLVIDVDRFRPEIERVVNDKIQGKFKLGKLKLSLWGQILINVDGVELLDARSQKILSVRDAVFHFPFAPLLTGAPVVQFRMNEPKLALSHDKQGKLNALSLIASSTPSTPAVQTAQQPSQATNPQTPTPAPTAPQTQPPAKPVASKAQEIALPALALRARIGIELLKAELNYKDERSGLTNQVRDLNFRVRNLSLTSPTEIEIWADLSTKLGSTFQVQGPFRVEGRVEPEISGTELKQAKFSLSANFSDLAISSPGLFEKAKGVPIQFGLSALITQSAAQIQKFTARFHNVDLSGSGQITDLEGARNLNFDLQSNAIELKAWSDLVPMLKTYDLSGNVVLQAKALGSLSNLGYQAGVKVKDFSLKVPYTKAKPVIQAQVQIRTDEIESLDVKLTAPGNELKLSGKLQSFSAPRFDFKVTSAAMDLDQWLEFPPAKSAVFWPQLIPSAYAADKKPASDYDVLLDPLRKNAIARAAGGFIGIDLQKLKVYGIQMTKVFAKLSLRDLVAQIESFSMGMIGGTVTAKALSDLKPAKPTYKFEFKAQGIEASEAVVAQFPIFKRTIYGNINAEGSGQGMSFNPEPAIKNLKMQGKFFAKDAVFSTIDIAKMTTEALSQALDRAGEKVPALKGKKLPALPDRKGKYQEISSNFQMENGVFLAPNFIAKSYPGNGVDLKGSTQFGMVDYALDARWFVTDTHNITKAREISVDLSGTRVDHILARGSDPVGFPVTVGCKMLEPCYKYTEVAEHFGKIALANIGDAAKGRLKQDAKKKVEETVNKLAPNAPAPVQNLIKGLFK